MEMATNAMVQPAVGRRIVNIGLWGLQLLAAYEFFRAGSAKLMSAPMMVQAFAAIGLGQWFRYFTGGLEVVCAAGLLIPMASGYAASGLVAVMLGAVATHLFILGGSPALPLSLLAAMLLVAWGRLLKGVR
jgi:putative oxidoreductase